jgi:hypothetical protein
MAYQRDKSTGQFAGATPAAVSPPAAPRHPTRTVDQPASRSSATTGPALADVTDAYEAMLPTPVTVETPECHMCGQTSTLTVTNEQIDAYRNGALIQDAFPNLDADERELLKTGIHTACWDRLTA